MSKSGPIVWLEDDQEDQQIMEEVLNLITPPRKLHMFTKAADMLHYLRTTIEQPFLILCDINMPEMNGMEVRKTIINDEYLRRKSIPFIFFSTTAEEADVRRAYDLVVQGYFEKGNNMKELQKRLERIFDYWNDCKHPNSYENRSTHNSINGIAETSVKKKY